MLPRVRPSGTPCMAYSTTSSAIFGISPLKDTCKNKTIDIGNTALYTTAHPLRHD